ncbi:MAG: DNA pilot protein [Microvirus sp.]|nr:MAG: DNA pilot protein [Microvirus sp.]
MGALDFITPGVGSVIEGGLGLVQGLTNAAFAKRNANITLEKNKELANYQYSKDLDMWNRGNQYNDPKAQMARLKAAGLNPNLVYGSGSVSGNTSGQLPKYQAPTADFSKIGNPIQLPGMMQIIQGFQNIEQTKANTDNLKTELLLKDVQRQNEEARTSGISWESKNKELEYEKNKIMLPYTKEGRELELSKISQEKSMSLGRYMQDMEKGRWDIEIKKNIPGIQEAQITAYKNNSNKAIQEVENLKVQGKIMSTDEKLRAVQLAVAEFEKGMKADGVNPNDPWYVKSVYLFTQKAKSLLGLNANQMK